MISRFRDDYSFLSNFYLCKIELDGIVYPSAENAFQAMKTTDVGVRKVFAKLTPSEAKKLGRHIQLRHQWDECKDGYMRLVVEAKFTQNNDLAKLLIATDKEFLVEKNNHHDNYWGECSCPRCARLRKHNGLGVILMDIRKMLNLVDTEGYTNAN